MKREIDIIKHVKFLIVKKLFYEIRLNYIKLQKILQDETKISFL
jgi:hypothetical protein